MQTFQRYVNLVDLAMSTSIESTKVYWLAKISVDTAENETLKITDWAAGENTELVVSRLLEADLVHEGWGWGNREWTDTIQSGKNNHKNNDKMIHLAIEQFGDQKSLIQNLPNLKDQDQSICTSSTSRRKT